jgi:hypothetical protein
LGVEMMVRMETSGEGCWMTGSGLLARGRMEY